MKNHANIPVFIPHLGCPNQCVFCNQRTSRFEIDSVIKTIEDALLTIPTEVETEIAFFGGSFTGIDRNLMIELLEIAYEYVKDGRVSSIRCSTRPDYIDQEILDILKKYGVKIIELGLQSVDEAVLLTSKRGHSFSDEQNAARLIIDNGFILVGQMMIGLPGSTIESELATARFICETGANAARVYPTVVFRETELCDMACDGRYIPLSVDEAVRRSAEVIRMFDSYGVKVIRVGLCASENLSDFNTYYAGPNHSALGELVENEIFYSIICEKIKELGLPSGASVAVEVPCGSLSKAIGQNKKNKLRLISEFSLSRVDFYESADLTGHFVKCEERKNKCI